jgi:hypothetical protein
VGATARERRGYPCRALSDTAGAPWDRGLGRYDELCGKKAWVEWQKRLLGATERDEQERSAFREYVRSIVSERFIFLDECLTNISLSPNYARAPVGERVYGTVPRN